VRAPEPLQREERVLEQGLGQGPERVLERVLERGPGLVLEQGPGLVLEQGPGLVLEQGPELVLAGWEVQVVYHQGRPLRWPVLGVQEPVSSQQTRLPSRHRWLSKCMSESCTFRSRSADSRAQGSIRLDGRWYDSKSMDNI